MMAKQRVSDLLSNGIPLFALHLLPEFERGSTADDAMYLRQMLTNPLAKFSFPKSASTSKNLLKLQKNLCTMIFFFPIAIIKTN